MDNSNPIVFIWLCFALFAVVAQLFLHASRNAALKRTLMPWLFATGWVLFGAMLFVVGAPTPVLAFMLSLAIPLGWLNWRMTRFCFGCGRTIRDRNPFVRSAFCPRCGTPLDRRVTTKGIA
jgi:hypothetical protein